MDNQVEVMIETTKNSKHNLKNVITCGVKHTTISLGLSNMETVVEP